MNPHRKLYFKSFKVVYIILRGIQRGKFNHQILADLKRELDKPISPQFLNYHQKRLEKAVSRGHLVDARRHALRGTANARLIAPLRELETLRNQRERQRDQTHAHRRRASRDERNEQHSPIRPRRPIGCTTS